MISENYCVFIVLNYKEIQNNNRYDHRDCLQDIREYTFRWISSNLRGICLSNPRLHWSQRQCNFLLGIVVRSIQQRPTLSGNISLPCAMRFKFNMRESEGRTTRIHTLCRTHFHNLYIFQYLCPSVITNHSREQYLLFQNHMHQQRFDNRSPF